MSGQIPKYGQHFRRESVPWTPDLASTIYVLKADPAWFIRSDKTSGIWRIYHGDPQEEHTTMGRSTPTFGLAMERLLEGIDRGFYATTDTTRKDQ